MYPELFHIGKITIYSYGFMILLGLIIGYFFFLHKTKTLGLNTDNVSSLFIWGILGVFIGGKLFYFLESPKYHWQHFSELVKNPGQGFVFYGSFIVTAIVFIIWFRKKGLNPWQMFDFVGISGAFVHGFGKIGCFLAGCCHGKVCNNWMGVTFTNPKSSASPLNTALYPTQLWDAFIIFIAIGLMLYFLPKKKFHGQIFFTYTVIYAIGRFFTEKFRGDESRGFLFNGFLSHSQFIAIVILIISIITCIYLHKNQKVEA